jgi:ferritin-like protein
MIKKVKKGDALKYLLHGLKDEETNKKVKKVTIQNLADCFDKKIQFTDKNVSMKMAKYFIEQPNEEGKIELMDDADFKGQTHAEAVSTRRKDLHAKMNEDLKNYPIFNGIAITSLLS